MADTIVRTFSLLIETDQKLEELTKLTFRRNKGDVIDWLVDEKWKSLQQGTNSDQSSEKPKDSDRF